MLAGEPEIVRTGTLRLATFVAKTTACRLFFNAFPTISSERPPYNRQPYRKEVIPLSKSQVHDFNRIGFI